MKIAITAFTGKVGKSTLCNTFAYPRMQEATIIRMETINDSGLSGAKKEIVIKGRDLAKLETELAKTNEAIVDIGASNVEAFMLALNSQFESHYAIDYYVVPVKADAKAQIEMAETMKTLQALSALGIEPERIKVLFNRLPVDADVEEECRALIGMHKKMPIFTLNMLAVIHESEAFAALAAAKKPYLEMLADPVNYRQELNKIPLENEKERTDMVKLIRAQGTVKMLDREMQAAWNALFGEAA
jgi:hypothetical protein